MRRITALLFAILMGFSLAACGEQAERVEEQGKTIVLGEDTAIGKDAVTNEPDLEEAPSASGAALEGTMSGKETDGSSTEEEAKEPTQDENTGEAVGDIRPEFKEAMDRYEAFYTEYCEVIKAYNNNPTDLTLLTRYADMLVKAEEMNEAFEAWNEDELSAEELKYYLDVNNRVMKMLVDVAA